MHYFHKKKIQEILIRFILCWLTFFQMLKRAAINFLEITLFILTLRFNFSPYVCKFNQIFLFLLLNWINRNWLQTVEKFYDDIVYIGENEKKKRVNPNCKILLQHLFWEFIGETWDFRPLSDHTFHPFVLFIN